MSGLSRTPGKRVANPHRGSESRPSATGLSMVVACKRQGSHGQGL